MSLGLPVEYDYFAIKIILAFIYLFIAFSISSNLLHLVSSSCLNQSVAGVDVNSTVSEQINNRLCRRHGMPPIVVASVERLHINHVESETRILICQVTLTFDLLTLKLVRIIARQVGNHPTKNIKNKTIITTKTKNITKITLAAAAALII